MRVELTWLLTLFLVSALGEVLSRAVLEVIGVAAGIYLPVLAFMCSKRGNRTWLTMVVAVTSPWIEFWSHAYDHEEGAGFVGLGAIGMLLFTVWILFFAWLGRRSHMKALRR